VRNMLDAFIKVVTAGRRISEDQVKSWLMRSARGDIADIYSLPLETVQAIGRMPIPDAQESIRAYVESNQQALSV
jgi:hypothetical protein